MDFAKLLKNLMIKQGLTEYSLAKRSGIPQPTINRWLNGLYLPTLQKLADMCAKLGVTLSDFFADDESLEVKISTDPESEGYTSAAVQPGTELTSRQAQAFVQAADHQIERRQWLHQELERLMDEYEKKKPD